MNRRRRFKAKRRRAIKKLYRLLANDNFNVVDRIIELEGYVSVAILDATGIVDDMRDL